VDRVVFVKIGIISCITEPIHLLKQGHLGTAAQDHAQMASEYLQGWPLHSHPGQPVPVPSHPHSEKVYPDVQRELFVFRSVLMASGPVNHNHWICKRFLCGFCFPDSVGRSEALEELAGSK